MINYEDIQKANELINTTDVKGKDYAEVNQRIKAFRSVCPDGNIDTTIVSNEIGKDGTHTVIVHARVYDGDGKQLGSGNAYEVENSTFINKTSYIENCETSAVGRALAMCGFGIDTSISSLEEVETAKLKQTQSEKIDKIKQKVIADIFIEKGRTVEDACKWFKVKKLADVTEKQFVNFNNKLNGKNK